MDDMRTESVGRLRVIKKLAPRDRGAIKLAERFGAALVCVRHRVDVNAKVRFTTVELVVARDAIKVRVERWVGVRVHWNETALQEMVRVAGAKWDGRAKVWRMPRRLASILRLTHRITQE